MQATGASRPFHLKFTKRKVQKCISNHVTQTHRFSDLPMPFHTLRKLMLQCSWTAFSLIDLLVLWLPSSCRGGKNWKRPIRGTSPDLGCSKLKAMCHGLDSTTPLQPKIKTWFTVQFVPFQTWPTQTKHKNTHIFYIYIYITVSGSLQKLLGVLVPLSKWWLKPRRILLRLTMSATLCLQNLRSVSSISSLKILRDTYLHLISSTITSKQHRMKSATSQHNQSQWGMVQDGWGWWQIMKAKSFGSQGLRLPSDTPHCHTTIECLRPGMRFKGTFSLADKNAGAKVTNLLTVLCIVYQVKLKVISYYLSSAPSLPSLKCDTSPQQQHYPQEQVAKKKALIS